MEQAIGFRPIEAWMGRDLVCVLENETKKTLKSGADPSFYMKYRRRFAAIGKKY